MRHNLKQSSIMADLHDYDIEVIEKESLWKGNGINIDVLLSVGEKTFKTV